MSGLAANVPAGQAQTAPPPFLCFDKDPRSNTVCQDRGNPDYRQGEPIEVSVVNTPGDVTIVARCVLGCPFPDPSATGVYYAIATDSTPVRFPRDFIQPGNDPTAPGRNANADKAGRYNSTWEFSAQAPGGPSARRANVWLINAFLDANETIRPGATHHLRAVGIDPGGVVSVRYERRDLGTGEWIAIRAPANARAPSAGANPGVYEDFFSLPPEEAQNILACGNMRNDCYRVVIDAPGKVREIVPIRAGIADIVRSDVTTPRPATVRAAERTANVSFDIDLYYPGGGLAFGPKLTEGGIPVSPLFGGRVLRAAVERVNATGEVSLVDEVAVRYLPERFLWRAQWSVPVDLPIDRTATYRLRMVEGRDAWGNRIPADVLGRFSVDVANLRPQIAASFTELERAQEGVVSLRVSYLNGTPFTPAEGPENNESPLSGCFVRLAAPPPEPAPDPRQADSGSCLGRNLTWGRYSPELEVWNFTTRYDRRYPDLDAHRFILQNGTEDRYGNAIFQVVLEPFVVVPAKPRVELSTVMRGVETDTFERGARIFVSAAIAYGDGSPYNHSVRNDPDSAQARTLTGILVRRGPAPPGAKYGPVASEQPFNLTETDPSLGNWGGFLDLTNDDTATPVGNWTFAFDVSDNVSVPNLNRTRFDREVVSSLVQLCPTYQPSSRASTGSILKFRYRLFYSSCDGQEVPPGIVGDRVTAQLYRFGQQNQTAFGAPVSGTLQPLYQRDAGNEWQIEYQIPNNLFAGTYAFVLKGTDVYGNRLASDARSRPFTTFTEVVNRSVVTQPAAEVRRGDTAVVVFDAREGDTGTDPARGVRIQLERFDTSTTACATGLVEGGCWVRELADVRAPDPTFPDHMGVYPIDIDTAVGVYRFSLQGRDSEFHLLTGISDNFTVVPTNVTRAFVTAPPESVVKGQVFSFTIEQLAGDLIRERIVLYNGRPVTLQPPQVSNQGPLANLTWMVPFDAPNGNYSILVRGRDVNGNTINVLSPPIEATAASLLGRMLGQPERTVERGETIRAIFGILYPNGEYYVGSETPRVVVRNASGAVADARVTRQGLTFAAEWQPPTRMPLGDYYFEINGARGAIGNEFPTLRSQTFRVAPGEVVRAAIDEVPPETERMATVSFAVPADATDKFVGFELAYYSSSTILIGNLAEEPVPLTRAPLPHTIDTSAGKYVARVVTDEATQVGTYRVLMTGEDRDGNRIVAQSRQFAMRATAILVTFDGYPDQDAFGEGKTIQFAFTARYRQGALMDDTYGTPSGVVTLTNEANNNRIITQRPEVAYQNGRWTMTWTAPEILPNGEYYFNVGGSDLQGNPISNTRTVPYVVSTNLGESFGKVIPGPSPVLVALLVAGIAGLLLRRRA